MNGGRVAVLGVKGVNVSLSELQGGGAMDGWREGVVDIGLHRMINTFNEIQACTCCSALQEVSVNPFCL